MYPDEFKTTCCTLENFAGYYQFDIQDSATSAITPYEVPTNFEYFTFIKFKVPFVKDFVYSFNNKVKIRSVLHPLGSTTAYSGTYVPDSENTSPIYEVKEPPCLFSSFTKSSFLMEDH